MTDNRRFWRILLLIVLGALVLRVGYVMLAKRTEPVLGDQIYYNAQANTIARGHGFTDFRDGSAAGRAPAAHRAGAHADVVGDGAVRPGRRHLLVAAAHHDAVRRRGGAAHRAASAARVAGNRAGLVAAGDRRALPEPLDQRRPGDVGDARDPRGRARRSCSRTGSSACRARRPRCGSVPRAGSPCSPAPSSGLLLPLMVLPVALFLHQFPFKRQLGLFLLACVAALAVVSPWLVANLTRFDEPVLFSTNDGLTICGANLHRTYYGEGTGLWALDCAAFPVPKGDRSVVSNALRSDGLRFIRDHLGRLPVVVGVRVARRLEPLRAGTHGQLQRERGPRRRGVVGRVLRVLDPGAVRGRRRRATPSATRADHAARVAVRDRDRHRGRDLRDHPLPHSRPR